MQVIGLEYLRFADGLEKAAREEREADFRQDVLRHLFKASLVASGGYKEEVVFQEYFPEPEDGEVDYTDNSGVDFALPDADEMTLLAEMLADDSVRIDGAPLEGPGAEQVSPPDDEIPALPPPRDFDPGEVEQDKEWV